MSGQMMNLWRPSTLVIRWIKQKVLCKTEREIRDAEAPGRFAYETAYATHLLIFLIVTTYSTLAPFILIWGFLYYLLAMLSQKYNIIYVFIPISEGGGQHWPMVFDRICSGLVIYQLVLIGEFIIYKYVAGYAISIVMLVVTGIFWWYTRQQFARSAEYGALDEILKPKPESTQDLGASTIEVKSTHSNKEVVDAYTQPSLKKMTDRPNIREEKEATTDAHVAKIDAESPFLSPSGKSKHNKGAIPHDEEIEL